MERALVKVEMRYGADVSYLCDLVRQRIVFDSFHDQLKCLRAMADGIQFSQNAKFTLYNDEGTDFWEIVLCDSFYDQLRCLRAMADGVQFLKSQLHRDHMQSEVKILRNNSRKLAQNPISCIQYSVCWAHFWEFILSSRCTRHVAGWEAQSAFTYLISYLSYL